MLIIKNKCIKININGINKSVKEYQIVIIRLGKPQQKSNLYIFYLQLSIYKISMSHPICLQNPVRKKETTPN